jgi:hypothetical protein
MKKFIVKLNIYVALIILLHIITPFFINGKNGDTYTKLTGKREHSLIIGTSRAAQGLVPEIIESELDGSYRFPLVNFSFNMSYSPFGNVYLNTIKKKIDTSSTNGLFIVTVDPWSIRGTKDCPVPDSCFFEENLTLNKVDNICSNPNYEYLLKCYRFGWGKLILDQVSSPLLLHRNGWLEVNAPMDSSSVHFRHSQNLILFKKKVSYYMQSQSRIKSLKKTINYLKNYGKVVLVRIPVHKNLKVLENLISPNFDVDMNKIAADYGIVYFPFNKTEEYQFTDGNHLYKESAIDFSRNLAKKISTLDEK